MTRQDESKELAAAAREIVSSIDLLKPSEIMRDEDTVEIRGFSLRGARTFLKVKKLYRLQAALRAYDAVAKEG